MGTHCSNSAGMLQFSDPRWFEWWGDDMDPWGEGYTHGQTGGASYYWNFVCRLIILFGIKVKHCHNIRKCWNVCMPVHCWIGDFGSPRLAELCYESLPEEWPNAKCTPKHPCTYMHSQRAVCFDVWQVSVETELGFVWPSGLLLSLWHHPPVIHTSVSSKEAETGEDLSSKNSCVPHTHLCLYVAQPCSYWLWPVVHWHN